MTIINSLCLLFYETPHTLLSRRLRMLDSSTSPFCISDLQNGKIHLRSRGSETYVIPNTHLEDNFPFCISDLQNRKFHLRSRGSETYVIPNPDPEGKGTTPI
jgi:hypothetical protein